MGERRAAPFINIWTRSLQQEYSRKLAICVVQNGWRNLQTLWMQHRDLQCKTKFRQNRVNTRHPHANTSNETRLTYPLHQRTGLAYISLFLPRSSILLDASNVGWASGNDPSSCISTRERETEQTVFASRLSMREREKWMKGSLDWSLWCGLARMESESIAIRRKWAVTELGISISRERDFFSSLHFKAIVIETSKKLHLAWTLMSKVTLI